MKAVKLTRYACSNKNCKKFGNLVLDVILVGSKRFLTKFCGACGKNATNHSVSHTFNACACGCPLEEGDSFCVSCGKSLSKLPTVV